MIDEIIEPSPSIIVSYPFNEQGKKLFKVVCRHNLEGIVAKKTDSPYLIGKRFRNWLKIKSRHVMIRHIIELKMRDGYWKGSIGTLLLAESNDSKLGYCGHVGTGLSRAKFTELRKRLSGFKCNWPIPKTNKFKGIQWLKPEIRCRIVYNQRTANGHLRTPVLKI